MARHSASRRAWSVLGLIFIVLTHNQAVAQTAAPKPNTTTGSRAETAMWKTVSDSLNKVMADTLASRPLNISASDMVQSATDFLKGLGTGKNLQNLGSMGAGIMGNVSSLVKGARVTNADLVQAFDNLRATTKALGVALPASSSTLDTWTKLADSMRAGGGNFISALPALMTGSTGNMAQSVDPPFPIPADFAAAALNLYNLGLDAVVNGPGATIGLTSLGLGLAAGITGILGGAFFIAGASILLGAGADSLSASQLQKYQNNTYVGKFHDLAAEAQWSILPAVLNPQNIQLVDLATQVLDRTISVTAARSG